MFAQFFTRLSAPRTGPLPSEDARLALCALLVRIARTDGVYDPAEIGRIDRIMARRYGLDTAATEQLRAEAEQAETEAPDTVRFTRIVKDAVPHEDRNGVVEALWEVVLADGVRDHHEDAQLRLMANLLGINDRDSALARQRVEARL